MISLPRVLVVHNRYLHRGGEDVVVDAEIALLRARGHEVEIFERSSEQLSSAPLKMALQIVWNSDVAGDIARTIAAFNPDVVHVHNTFPFISPSIYSAVQGRAIVQTLHNFRLLCPQAMLLHEGRVCEDCVGHFPWRGAVRGCYRGSQLRSTAVAGMLTLHRMLNTWNDAVTRYIALNEFGRAKFIEGGIPANRIVVKPNFVDAPPAGMSATRDGFLFVGRLSPEKGLDVLCRAAAGLGGAARVYVAGSGPDAGCLTGATGIEALGALSPSLVQARMAGSLALVMPSVWYETFGLVIVEAFAAGLPVIASRLGAMASLVRDGETGLLFTPGDAEDLREKMLWALNHPTEMAVMGERAKDDYEAQYTPSRNYMQMTDIYKDAIEEVRRGGK
jgi:glycosyltransferase involved in cell wall biosynthesis